MKTWIVALLVGLLQGGWCREQTLPNELVVRLMGMKFDGTMTHPIPITETVLAGLQKGPFPGDLCDGIPCQIPYHDWYCSGLCRATKKPCKIPKGTSVKFCTWCAVQGCFYDHIPDTEDSDDYFGVDYEEGPYQNLK